jgi:hypothetical protein
LDFNALQEQVKELIQKLITEFRAIKHETEAFHLDSVQLAVAACKAQHPIQ